MSAQPEASAAFDVRLLIGGSWVASFNGRTLPVVDPSTGQPLGRVAVAGDADLERAVAAAARGARSMAGCIAVRSRPGAAASSHGAAVACRGDCDASHG